MKTTGEIPIDACTYFEAGCMHSVLYELCGVEDRDYETLTLMIDEISHGEGMPTPFEVFGQLAIDTVARLEELARPGYIYEEEALVMLTRYWIRREESTLQQAA